MGESLQEQKLRKELEKEEIVGIRNLLDEYQDLDMHRINIEEKMKDVEMVLIKRFIAMGDRRAVRINWSHIYKTYK